MGQTKCLSPKLSEIYPKKHFSSLFAFFIPTGVYILASQENYSPPCRDSSLFFGTFITVFFKFFRFSWSSFKFFPVFQFGQNSPPPPGRREMARIYIPVFQYCLSRSQRRVETFKRRLSGTARTLSPS